MKVYLAIYKETQQLASFLADKAGYVCKPESFHSDHKDFRIRGYFNTASEVMERFNQHEMEDIIEEVEEHLNLKEKGSKCLVEVSIPDLTQTAKNRIESLENTVRELIEHCQSIEDEGVIIKSAKETLNQN